MDFETPRRNVLPGTSISRLFSQIWGFFFAEFSLNLKVSLGNSLSKFGMLDNRNGCWITAPYLVPI